MAKTTVIATNAGKKPTKAAVNAAASGMLEKVRVLTPIGRILYPHLLEPHSQGQYPTNKFQCDILFDKSQWEAEGKAARIAVLKAGRAFFGNPKANLSDFKNPFKDGDDKEQELWHGSIYMTPRSQFKPRVVGPDMKDFSDERIRLIKGGDYVRLVLSIYPYSQQGGGITCGLEVVQFAKEGEAIGGGRGASLELLSEIEVDLEDPSEADDEEVAVDDEEDMDDGIRI